MTANAQTVAILIAARNARATIGRAVATALAQAETAQVMVVDDASIDDTGKAAKACDDGSRRLEVVRLDRNLGPALARNLAMSKAQAPFVAVLDADDYLLPGRFAPLLELAAHGFDIVADDLFIADGPGPRQRLWSDAPFRPHVIDLAVFAQANVPAKDRPYRELGFVKPLMSRAFLEKRRLAYSGAMRLGEDFDLYARALAHGARFLLCDAAGYVAVRTPGSLSRSHAARDLGHFVLAIDALRRRPGIAPGARAALRRLRRAVSCKWAWASMIEAVKARDVGGCARPLAEGPFETVFVGQRLAEQAWSRFAAPALTRVPFATPR